MKQEDICPHELKGDYHYCGNCQYDYCFKCANKYEFICENCGEMIDGLYKNEDI